MSFERTRWPRRVAIPAITSGIVMSLGLGVGAGVYTHSADASPDHPTEDAPRISVLETTEASAEARGLATTFDGNPFARTMGIDVGGIRQGIDSEEGDVFVVPTTSGWTCVILLSDASHRVPVASCLPTNSLTERPIVVEAVREDGSADIGGVVPDGYVSAATDHRTTRVSNNAFLLTDVAGKGVLEVTGEGQVTLRSRFGG